MKHCVLAALVLLGACRGASAPGITVDRALFVPGPGLAPGAIYAVVDNTGGVDTLQRISSKAADTIELHSTMTDAEGRTMMHGGASLVIASRTTSQLAPGRTHGMASGVHGPFVRGDSVQLVFHFARSGDITAHAVVLDYSQVDSALSARTRRGR
jgi:copper(I)-binding protein